MGYFKKALFWLLIKGHMIILRISIALRNTEVEILKANPDDLDESKKKTTRKLHRNTLLEKFYAGRTDEKYVQDYYELLKKADKFKRSATPFKFAVAADRHGMSEYGDNAADEHMGFFDGKHRFQGKTIDDVVKIEMEERRTKDDDFEILYIFDNKPIEVGLAKVFDGIDKSNEKLDINDVFQESKRFEFPIKITRNVEAINKLEQLSEFLHVKKIGFEFRQLEFFIPFKFKTINFDEDSDIFKELINIKNVYIRDEYGELMGFTVIKFTKRIIHDKGYDVLKFEGHQMEMHEL